MTDNDHQMYLDERRLLVEGEVQVAASLDKTLLTLSGGALAVSMTFVKDIFENPVCTFVLVVAWVLFGLTVGILLLSMYFCQLAYKKQRKILDKEQREKYKKQSNNPVGRNESTEKRNVWSALTEVGNLISIVLFLIGLIFLGTFIGINM